MIIRSPCYLTRTRSSSSHADADDLPAHELAAHADILRQDLRFALRTMRRAPGFALTAIAIVALGIGANTAAFSLADFVLLRPLPFPDSDRLVRLWSSTDGSGPNDVSPANYRDWKAMSKSFRGMGAYSSGQLNLVGQGAPIRLETARVTPDLLLIIGVTPFLGSAITPANSAAGGTAVLSHDLWRNQFDSDPNVVGRVVRLNGEPHTVIGVMPREFHFPGRDVELWTPLTFSAEDLRRPRQHVYPPRGQACSGRDVRERTRGNEYDRRVARTSVPGHEQRPRDLDVPPPRSDRTAIASSRARALRSGALHSPAGLRESGQSPSGSRSQSLTRAVDPDGSRRRP